MHIRIQSLVIVEQYYPNQGFRLKKKKIIQIFYQTVDVFAKNQRVYLVR